MAVQYRDGPFRRSRFAAAGLPQPSRREGRFAADEFAASQFAAVDVSPQGQFAAGDSRCSRGGALFGVASTGFFNHHISFLNNFSKNDRNFS